MRGELRYCLDCGWRIHNDEYDDPSALMIDHAVETGHDLDSGTESKAGERRWSSSARPRFWEWR